MAQPIGIVAKIKLSEDAYKKFIKQTANEIAEELFFSFWRKSSDVYLFQYNKKQATLYSFVYYHYGNSETLRESNIYKALHKIEPFLEADSEGYFFATLDSLSFSDFVIQEKIENKQWKSFEFSRKEIADIWKEAGKKFFNKIEDVTDYAVFFNENKSFIDTPILKRFNVLQEEARIKTVKEDLPNATLLNPAQLFKGYFFNGSTFYYCDGVQKIVCFDNINLQTVEEKEYGLTDGEYVIIGEKAIKTDGKKFKKLHKSYTTFYKTDAHVYDEHLNSLENADAKTFKLTTYKRDIGDIYYGEDKDNIYYLGNAIGKNEVGDIRFSNDLFYNEALLMGSKQLYLGADLVPEVDAPTFEKLRLENKETFEWIKENYCSRNSPANAIIDRFYYGRDKRGELFIFKTYAKTNCPFIETSFGFKNHEIVVLRKTAEEFWEFYKAYRKEIFDKAPEHLTYYDIQLTNDTRDSLAYYQQYNAFVQSPSFKKIVDECKYHSDFLTQTNNYLHSCWQLYTNSQSLLRGKDKSYLETGLSFYKSVEHEFIGELNPFIFHHLCCFCVALNKMDDAILYFQKAFLFGYSQFHLMLTDEDLKPLSKHPSFIKIEEWFAQYVSAPVHQPGVKWQWTANPNPFPLLNEENIKLLEALPKEVKEGKPFSGKADYVQYLMENCFVWDVADTADEVMQKQNKLTLAFAPYFNRYLQNTMSLSWQEGCAYHFYKDYKITNAKSHLARLEYIYFNAHNEYGIKKINEEEVDNLIQRIKQKYEEASEDDKSYIKNSHVLAMLHVSL